MNRCLKFGGAPLALILLTLVAAWPVSSRAQTEPTAKPSEISAVANDSALQTIQARITHVAVLRGAFSQEKQLAGFRHPLRSQGRFLLARDRGVVWTTLKPFPSEMVVTQDRILTRQRDGKTRVEADASQQPALRSINTLLFALMGGNLEALAARFDVADMHSDAAGWHVALTPKAGALTQVFTRITLAGDTTVQEVDMEERSGDRTRIQFSELDDSASPLSSAEAQHFE
ncbi:MAG: outer membrane lipoprotein carrier protein LolA [Xanthomonadales bacterium]|nr:outer membrane lipoprotein carrier protein LolA [Xanthomonadales bacterium]